MDKYITSYTKLTNPIVILINGYPKSGKDTFCDIVGDYFNVVTYSTIDIIKYAAKLMGWDGEKTFESRAMLSALKDFSTKWFDTSYNEMTNLIIQDRINSPHDFIFIHIRESKEINRMIDWCSLNKINCYTMCVERNECFGIEQSNHADINIHDFIYDIYIHNNGTIDQFKQIALKMMNDIYNGDIDKWINV